jgi:hypothetical protein
MQWFAWNGLVLYLLHAGIKNIKFDVKKLEIFMDYKYHPATAIFSLIVSLLPLINADNFKLGPNSYLYVCHFAPTGPLSAVLYLISYILPMWLLVAYSIYIYVDLYKLHHRLKLRMPQNYFKLVPVSYLTFKMYQPLMIVLTWIWPSAGFID